MYTYFLVKFSSGNILQVFKDWKLKKSRRVGTGINFYFNQLEIFFESVWKLTD